MLALIPARGGSVGLPGKNTKMLCDMPLIAYTIEAAKFSGIFERIIVSTDDEEIARVSLSYGAEVPFIRPEELATNEAKSMDVVIHTVEWLEEHELYSPDIVTVLQPTSPFRDAQTIRDAYDLFKFKNASRLVSLCETIEHFYWMYSLNDGYLSPVSETYQSGYRRQDLPKAYSLNGALYMGNRELIVREETYFGTDTIGFEMSRLKSVDINDILDFALAETIIERGMLHEQVELLK